MNPTARVAEMDLRGLGAVAKAWRNADWYRGKQLFEEFVQATESTFNGRELHEVQKLRYGHRSSPTGELLLQSLSTSDAVLFL